MTVTNQTQSLNYWIAGLEARLHDQPPPSIPPDITMKIPIEEMATEDVALNMDCVFYALSSGTDGNPGVSEQTYLKVHSLASQVLRIPSISPAAATRLREFLEHTERAIDSKIDPYFSTRVFLKRDPKDFTATEIRQIENLLFLLITERTSLPYILAHEFFDFCKHFMIHKAENLGGIWKPARKAGWVNLDWEKIPTLPLESLAICAQLERAQHEGDLVQNLRRLTENQSSFDSTTNTMLSLWQTLTLVQSLSQMEATYSSTYDLILKKIDYKKYIHDQYVSAAIQQAIEKNGSPEYAQLQQHCLDQSCQCPFDTAFQYLSQSLQRISLNAIAYRRRMEGCSSLYRQGYETFFAAIAHQKGFLKTHRPVTPDEFDRFSTPAFRSPREILSDLEKPIWFDILSTRGKVGLCEALLRAVCPDDEIFIRQVLEFLALVKPRKSPPSPISAPPATIKEPSPKPQKASPPTTQHTEKYTQQIPANEPTKTHKTKSRRRITSVVLPTTDAQPPHQSSKSSTPSLEPTPQQKPAEKVVEEVASVTNALGALHLSEAPQQPVVQGTHETSSPQGMEAYEPFAKAPKYCVSYPPLLARRVNDQMRIARNTLDCGQKFDDAVAFHSYPIFLSQIIRANTPAKPWFSKTTGRVNEHHSCIGSICRYKDRLPPVVGYFGDCFDKNVLYHHFFKPLHQMPMIERYQTTGSFIDHTDLPTPPSEGRQQEGVFTPEVDTPERYVTQTRGLLFILDDTRAGIVYTAAFFNPVQVVS